MPTFPVGSILDRYVAKFPAPQRFTGESSDEHEERCRQWSIKFAQQVVYERPGEGFGVKSTAPGTPISKDSLAQQVTGALYGWDLLIGAGTGFPIVASNPAFNNITGQNFIAVEPKNWLDDATTPPPQPPSTVCQSKEIIERIAQLEVRMADDLTATRDLIAALSSDFDRLITLVAEVRTRQDHEMKGKLGLTIILRRQDPNP